MVVYLYIPTSNHNRCPLIKMMPKVVYLYIPTSNHNNMTTWLELLLLYIFIFLHQTTTCPLFVTDAQSCISLYSYIKPQHQHRYPRKSDVVYLYIPTSNHNPLHHLEVHYGLYIFIFLHQTTTCPLFGLMPKTLYIFIFLHQTTTPKSPCPKNIGCISLYSYIKPQQYDDLVRTATVVYLYIPTSNHNAPRLRLCTLSVVYLYIPTSNHNP